MAKLSERRAFLGLLAAGGIGARRALAAAPPKPAGVVESARGDCYAMTGAARHALAPDAKLLVGDLVATGTDARMALLLGTATKVKLGADSRLRIDRFIVDAGGLLTLDGGAMLYDHDDGHGGGDTDAMTVRSPFGLMAVRGTRFFAGPSNGVFGVLVQRGSVLVVAAQQAVLLTSGMGTDIAQPGAAPTSPILWGAPRVAAALRSVE